MMDGLTLERKITLAVLVALIIQVIAGLIWTGGAIERLATLEEASEISRASEVRLARLETRLETMGKQLDRIETRLEAEE